LRRIDATGTSGLSMQTSFGNGNGQRVVGLGLGLGH